AVLYLGKLMEIAPTEEILQKPHHPYTELLITAAPRMNFRAVTTELFGATIEKSEGLKGGCIFRNRCKYATQICTDEEPPLDEKSRFHSVACHNWLNRV
ncbi:MAG: oligopeptide/dipeptide ABC transporter ATP-binding protein, partial [Nitrososphaerales archaeon]